MSKQTVVLNSVLDIDTLVWTGNHFGDIQNFVALDMYIRTHCSTVVEAKVALTKFSAKLGDTTKLTDNDVIVYLDSIGVQYS